MKIPGDSFKPLILNKPNIVKPERDWQNNSVMRFEIKPTVDVEAKKLLYQALKKISEMEGKIMS